MCTGTISSDPVACVPEYQDGDGVILTADGYESRDEISVSREEEDRKVEVEAKLNRKIAELEITNRSLLAINISLERVKDRQAKEIRELKRKLRKSRLILPNHTHRAVRLSRAPEEEEVPDSGSDSSSGGPSGSKIQSKFSNDEASRSMTKFVLEGLSNSKKRVLKNTEKDYMDPRVSDARVLTAKEVRPWRDLSGQDEDSQDTFSGYEADDEGGD